LQRVSGIAGVSGRMRRRRGLQLSGLSPPTWDRLGVGVAVVEQPFEAETCACRSPPQGCFAVAITPLGQEARERNRNGIVGNEAAVFRPIA